MHEIKINFFDGTDDEIGAPFGFCGKTYFGNGLTVARMKELEAFFNETNRTKSWGLIQHIENAYYEEMYTSADRMFLLFLVLGCVFETVSSEFNKK